MAPRHRLYLGQSVTRGSTDVQVSIWTTLSSLVRESTESYGLDTLPLRQSVTEYLVGEVLSEVGSAELEYSFTGVAGNEEGLPDAFSLEDSGNLLNIIVLVGRLGEQRMPSLEAETIQIAARRILETAGSLVRGEDAAQESGREGAGEYINTLKGPGSAIRIVDLKIIALGHSVVVHDSAALSSAILKGLDTSDFDEVRIECFDIPTLQDQWDRSAKSGTVDLALTEFLGTPLRCLRTVVSDGGFETYLAILPGEALADIYQRYRSRILQKNLRNFLQAKGKVNKGIQKTLREQPGRFLAYNNGLTITASSAELNEAGHILLLRDFQIVNGGQTTASLDYARRFAGVDLSKVSVQTKITVIDTDSDPTFIDDVSNFANSQNKVKLSDFASRDNFQVALAKIMRDNPDLACRWVGREQVDYWYYEAFRGGYATAKFQLTGSARARFEAIFPKHQVIDKLDLAKCENGWDGHPHLVCRGADKNFLEWVRRTRPDTRIEPDVTFCQELIAKVMIFRGLNAVVLEEGFSGFKSQIVAYSFSAMRIALEQRGKEVDLSEIWDRGNIPVELRESMVLLTHYADEFLRSRSGKEDTAQWAKKLTSGQRLHDDIIAGRVPKIYPILQRAGLLRDATIDISAVCSKVVDALRATKSPLTRNELLKAANVHPSWWEDVKQHLTANFDMIQTGHGPGTRYLLDD